MNGQGSDGDVTMFSPTGYEEQKHGGGQILSIFDSGKPPFTIDLGSFRKPCVTFGRLPDNDIVLQSELISRNHGEFVNVNGAWMIRDRNSVNGIIYNEQRIQARYIADGDLFRIDGPQAKLQGVLFVVSAAGSPSQWRTVPVGRGISIGRATDCGIVLPHISVSQHHAIISPENGGYFIYDTNSTNGIIVNGRRISGKAPLHEKDVILITNTKLIFSGQSISYSCRSRSGISVDTQDVVIVRKQRGKEFITSQYVSLNIHPGELVAIIGGSGAGKSTILNAMCGYLPPASGGVYINGVDLYRNFDALKKLVGYVPQSDIVYDNLTLYDMLSYATKLRLPADATPQDREQAINRAIATVELTDKRGALIKNLSGGQRKRASIAVELLSDPNLLFLDEPASGLDPGTERNLMHSLRSMADGGKTVILVTHSTLQLRLCDKIVFMGKGGYLCFYGSYNEALRFFGVRDIVDVYNLMTDHALDYARKYEQMRAGQPQSPPPPLPPSAGARRESMARQLGVLCSRYIKLIVNDRQRLLLLLAQAPLLAFLISFVADGEQFEKFSITRNLLFALSCVGFWIGMLNSIQEICKERTILKREYMTGLRLDAYMLSKVLVLGLFCAVQSLMVTGVFAAAVGLPEDGVIMPAFMELFMTTFLSALAAAAMGLFVSSLFDNPDRAMTVAPILLLPQILFCGIIFNLEGAAEALSYVTVCRWGMEAYGSTSHLTELSNIMDVGGIEMDVPIGEHNEELFEATASHLMKSWLMLAVIAVVFITLALIALRKIKKETA